MGTFRRSRTTHMDDIHARVPRLAPPNDGVSYGSAGGHVLRKSPLGAALWQTNDGKAKSKHHTVSVTVSPVIFPVRDGERTPTGDQYPDPLQDPLSNKACPRKSHKQKRKEKRLRSRPIRNPPTSIPMSYDFHRPLAIVPSMKL